jgi:1-acyl-sn-glycerol-3-phosphate acyltransferase
MSRGFSPVAYAGFSIMFRQWMKTRISGISISTARSDIPRDVPLLLVANHVSWWDGFLLIELQRVLRPNAPFSTVMLESELRQSPFLRRIGAIGIDPDSPSTVLGAIHEVTARVKERPDTLVFFFPQGRIRPSWRRPLGFKRGIEVFAKALGDVAIVPVGLHIEPLNRVAPHVFIRAGELVIGGEVSSSALEAMVTRELDQILETLSEHGEDAPRQTAMAAERLPAPRYIY